jgi:hypothetical protein
VLFLLSLLLKQEKAWMKKMQEGRGCGKRRRRGGRCKREEDVEREGAGEEDARGKRMWKEKAQGRKGQGKKEEGKNEEKGPTSNAYPHTTHS